MILSVRPYNLVSIKEKNYFCGICPLSPDCEWFATLKCIEIIIQRGSVASIGSYQTSRDI